MKLIKIFSLLILTQATLLASTNFFNEGVTLFELKNFDKAKFKFEQDIVHNPRAKNHICTYQRYLKYKKKRS